MYLGELCEEFESGSGMVQTGNQPGLELAELGGRNSVGETTIQLGKVDDVCAVYAAVLDSQGY
jgi:hypothetical protein